MNEQAIVDRADTSKVEMTSSEPRAAVRIENLKKSFSGGNGEEVAAVAGISLTVAPSELLVLLGPSGCGKSTLLRCIAGLETPDAGRIAVGEQTVFDAGKRLDVPPENRKIGMVFQSYALWPHMTVAKNIAFPLFSRKMNRDEVHERVESILKKMSITGLGHRYPSELSGGQQQRVSLARSLVDNPPVVLFDEPLSSVDAAVRRDLRAELRELKVQNKFAGVYVTHDQDEAMELGDKVAVVSGGSILQLDTPYALYHSPEVSGVGTLVGRMNVFPAQMVHEGGQAVARFALGNVTPVFSSEPARDGDQGAVGIRPENVALTAVATPSGIQGTVHRTVFYGAHADTIVRVGDIELIAATQQPDRRPLREGDDVWVDLAGSLVHWLKS